MTRQEYLNELFNYYEIEKELSRKEASSLLLLRHRTLHQKLVVRSTERSLPIAGFLKTILFRHLPVVYDAVQCEDGDVILEEALSGRTLEEVLRERTMTVSETKYVLTAVSDALRVVHEAGFVHRDVKPKNIMLTDDAEVKLIDFDASRRFLGSEDTVRLGTAGFAAPEQYIGTSGPRTDIFALGVLLNVMLTGRHPSDALPKNPRLRHIVEKATAMNPEKRYASAEEFRNAL